MVLLSAVSDAFSNPDSPWYYVVGTAFLVLILAALAVYVILSRRKSKRDAQDPEKSVSKDEISDTTPPSGEQPLENEPSNNAEQPEAEQTPAEEQSEVKDEPAPVAEEKEEAVDQTETEEKPVEQPVAEEKPAAPKKQPAKNTTTKSATTKSTTAKSTASKTTTAKKKPTQKAFIDRLIATTEVHAVYNELKNTILSYPGVKAKLSKEDETFSFGEEKKAKLALNGMNIELYLSVDKDSVPSQFGVEQGDDEFSTKLTVDERRIDDAQKLIVFAMNVSMLTRNDKHRHVNYVQNAIKAKEKAKKN